MEVSIAGSAMQLNVLHVHQQGAHLLVFYGEQPGAFKAKAIPQCSQPVARLSDPTVTHEPTPFRSPCFTLSP